MILIKVILEKSGSMEDKKKASSSQLVKLKSFSNKSSSRLKSPVTGFLYAALSMSNLSQSKL